MSGIVRENPKSERHMSAELEFRIIPASKGKDPRYNGIDCFQLWRGDERWGTVWQSVGGWNWLLLVNHGDGTTSQNVGGTCANATNGQRQLVKAYWAFVAEIEKAA